MITMKKIITTVIAVAFAGSTMAQLSGPVDTSWKKGGIGSINFNQVALNNWGSRRRKLNVRSSIFDAVCQLCKRSFGMDNQLDLAYGLLKSGDAEV